MDDKDVSAAFYASPMWDDIQRGQREWSDGYAQGYAEGKQAHWNGLFYRLRKMHTPGPIYYWLLDRLTDNNGWRPLQYRGWKKAPEDRRDAPNGAGLD